MADDDFGEEDVADIDFSQIRKSIQLGGRMIEQILNGVHYGSPEVRCLLLDECDIILECKVCRALFRALPNFVAHKRVYCKKAYVIAQENFLKTLPEEEVVVVQPCSPEEDAEECLESRSLQHQTEDERVQNTIKQITEGNLGKSEMYKLYSKAADKVEKQKKTKKSLDVVLSRIASNPHAVRVEYQEHMETQETDMPQKESVHQANPVSRRKPDQTARATQASTTEDVCAKISVTSEKNVIGKVVKEENKSIKANKVVCDEERKLPISPDSSAKPDLMENGEDADKPVLGCLQCNTTYSSRKLLLDHVQTKHSRMRTFFPCPYCKNVFFYFWGLTRHLRVNHKKTPNQINKMRKSLRDSAFTRTVTKTCVQAKDQLAHTEDMDSSPEKCSDKPDPITKSAPLTTKVVSKATVKVTSRSAKHTFASRHVPRIEESTENSSPPKSPTVLNNGGEKKYTHQLICEWCQKVFWKKLRLTKHKKFCSFGKNAYGLQKSTSRNLECPCGKTFLKKMSLLRHATICNRKRPTEDRNIQDKDESVMFACPFCKRTFGRKSSLENHKRACVSPETLSRSNSDRTLKTKIRNDEKCLPEKDVRLEGDVDVKPKPKEKVKSSPPAVKDVRSSGILVLHDLEELTAIVDESTKKCKKCSQKFSNLCNLRCHAFRHLGWKRFKCKLCSFSSHRKTECGVHIMKSHSDKCSTQSTDLFLIDLKLEPPDVHGNTVQSDSVVIKENNFDQLKDPKPSSEQFIISGVDHSRKFNISTRNSPRKFDTRPYKKLDNMSTLFTRKGYYPKQNPKSVQTTTPEHPSRKRHASESIEIVKTSTVKTSPSNKDSSVDPANEGPQKRVDSDGDGKQVKKIEVTVYPSKPSNKYEKVESKPERLPSSNDSKTADMLAPWPRSPEPMSVEEMFALIRRSPKDGAVFPGRRKSATDVPSTKPKELAQTPGDKQADKSSHSAPRVKGNLSARVSRKGSPSGNLLSRSMRTNRPGVDWSQNVKKQSRRGSDVGHLGSEDEDLKET